MSEISSHQNCEFYYGILKQKSFEWIKFTKFTK